MRIALISIACMALALSAAASDTPSLDDLERDNSLLKAEYDLARSGKPYLLVDLLEQRLLLKVSGLSLEQWPIDGYRSWGHPSALPAVPLAGRSALDEPERDVQVVNSGESSKPEEKITKALELQDMPSFYRLRLANGTVISVSPTSASLLAKLARSMSVPAWYLSRPLISSWNFLRGSPYNELALVMAAGDARSLYWAFSEGTPCLIRRP
jgi:hypothetical protein